MAWAASCNTTWTLSVDTGCDHAKRRAGHELTGRVAKVDPREIRGLPRRSEGERSSSQVTGSSPEWRSVREFNACASGVFASNCRTAEHATSLRFR